jgi:hypothetical protein
MCVCMRVSSSAFLPSTTLNLHHSDAIFRIANALPAGVNAKRPRHIEMTAVRGIHGGRRRLMFELIAAQARDCIPHIFVSFIARFTVLRTPLLSDYM